MAVPLPFRRIHGVLRGLEGTGRSEQFEGRFGRMFRTLPPASFAEDDIKKLARLMVAEAEGAPTPETEADDEENTGGSPGAPTISAGYTYLGQFIDHDLTFDPASSLMKQNDPDALEDFRTPRFDLDNLYGRGPDDQPYLYQDDGIRMLLGRTLTGNADDARTRDVPRNSPAAGPKRALIGDPRNDENVVVSQLQAAFLRFHNRVADVTNADDFHTVQRLVRWHYQWAVLNDFLPTMVEPTTLAAVLPHVTKQTTVLNDPPQLRFYRPKNGPFIPVEFSVAAYRSGHSMIRPVYRLNQRIPRFPIFDSSNPNPNASLVGFREFPANWAIEWKLFFKMGDAPDFGPERIQPAYKIDSSLQSPLGKLPPSVASSDFPSLAERNLLRGLRMGLPSGQAVAKAMGVPVVPDGELRVGKANEDDTKTNPLLVDISPGFKNNAPLWYYILAESQQVFVDNNTPIRLGPVGGRIVCEVFAGLMMGDQHSFLKQEPTWKPFPQFQKNGKFGMAELIAQAMQV